MGLLIQDLAATFPATSDYPTFADHVLLENPLGMVGVHDVFNPNCWAKQGAPDASNQSLLNLVSGGPTLTLGATPGAVDAADPGWDATRGFTFLSSGIRLQGGANYSFTTQGFLQILHLNLDASAGSGTHMIAGKFAGSLANDQYVLYCNSGNLTFSTVSPSAGAFDAAAVSLSGLLSQDIQVAYSWQPIFGQGFLNLYVNGTLVAQTITATPTLNTGSTPFGIGFGSFANTYFRLKSFTCENLTTSGNDPAARVLLDYVDNFT